MRKSLLLFVLIFAASPAAAVWREARSAHFIVYSEDKPETLKDFATELERYDAAMRVLRDLPQTTDSPNNRLTIFQVSNMAAVQKIMGKGSANVGGFYEGRAGSSFAFVPRRAGSGASWDVNAQIVLLHEYAHHFMFRNYPFAFPRWFSEGYAEFNSTARFVADGSVDLGLPAKHRSFGLRFNGASLADVIDSDSKKVNGLLTEAIYSRGWLLTHYLTFSKDRAGQLTKYLLAINKGTPSLTAAQEVFGDLGKLDRELQGYENARLSYRRIPANLIRIAPVEIRELSAGAGAIMPVMMRSRRGVDEESAKEVVKDARAAAAPYPDDPFVQLALAEAEIDAGNLDACDKATDKVLAAEPNNIRALIFKGRVAVAHAAENPKASAEDWKQARHWFVKANRTEPDAPAPLLQFYGSFGAEGVPATANAITGLRAAAMLAPEDESVRMLLGHQLLVDGKGPEARATLAAAAYSPHGGGMADLAGRVIAAIDKGGAGAGLKAWNEKGQDAQSETASH
ncbi:hypothetical protein SCH01S_05_00020 [Sphingomonas changbaiensis NBRC 104936]|uniref:DUF1570 domain-containing protein n=1 Tax=Sphingomonas changbaiensis NBRC 104936 TaxID=1219043 RepID=A0A0E9MKR7_9SPHN|nr:hypothetical protein [Sphingomonas changbaiensis]GAO38134.1 hypothetical protein SCH01S_05_00020 [Sphingomonas changbaiensis NBRC 104936]